MYTNCGVFNINSAFIFFIWPILEARAEILQKFWSLFCDGVSRKNVFEIYWPLNKRDLKIINLYFSEKGVKKEASLWVYRVLYLLTVVCIIDIKGQNIKGLGKWILENTAVCNKAG